MTPYKELFAIADRLAAVRTSADFAATEEALAALDTVAAEAARAFSGSWLGYHSHVYYAGLKPTPPGAHFSQEWGLMDMSIPSLGSRGDWHEYDPDELQACLRAQVGDPNLNAVHAAAEAAEAEFGETKADIRSILLIENPDNSDTFLASLVADLGRLQPMPPTQIVEIWSPKGQVMTRDTTAVGREQKCHLIS